jgi:hypothetical protein
VVPGTGNQQVPYSAYTHANFQYFSNWNYGNQVILFTEKNIKNYKVHNFTSEDTGTYYVVYLQAP